MLKRYFAPLVLASLVLAGCQSPPEGKFTPEQIAAMKSYGFNELNGDWSLGLSDTILFDKNDARLRSESETQIQSMASRLAKTGLNQALSLKRANAVADAWAKGANIPRENLTTRGLGKKYPIASNSTAQGRAENRRVSVVISTP